MKNIQQNLMIFSTLSEFLKIIEWSEWNKRKNVTKKIHKNNINKFF